VLVGGSLGGKGLGLGADGEVDGPSDETLVAECRQAYYLGLKKEKRHFDLVMILFICNSYLIFNNQLTKVHPSFRTIGLNRYSKELPKTKARGLEKGYACNS